METVKRQVLIAPKQQQGQRLEQLRLPHPRTGDLRSYYADIQHETVLEAATVDMEGKRSWLGSDWVIGDGSISVLVPIDPMFLYLGLLTKMSTAGDDEWKYVDISVLQLETHDQMDAFSVKKLFSMASIQKRALNEFCLAKEITEGTSVVKIDSTKVLSWLKRKCSVDRFPKAMEGIISSKAQDKELVKQAKIREMALLVSEYLSPYWTSRLFAEFGGFDSVQEEGEHVLSKQVQAIQFDSPDSYTMGVPNPQTLTAMTKTDKPKTAKEKQMEKAAKKSKPIISFFQKKTTESKP